MELFGTLPGEMDVLERASWSASALARLLDALLEGRLSISIFPSIQGVCVFEFGAVNNQRVNRSGKPRLSVEGKGGRREQTAEYLQGSIQGKINVEKLAGSSSLYRVKL